MSFGKFIKNRRLKMKMGLRTFAEKIGEDAGNWSRVENGRFPAPTDIKILNKMCDVLEINVEEKNKFFDLAARDSKEKIPADIREQIKENEIVPILFRTISKKKLSKEQLKQLVRRIKNES